MIMKKRFALPLLVSCVAASAAEGWRDLSKGVHAMVTRVPARAAARVGVRVVAGDCANQVGVVGHTTSLSLK